MADFLLGAGALALLQVLGAALFTVASPSQARDVWEALAVTVGWPILAPLGILRDARWHWRQRHHRTPRGGAGAFLARAAIRLTRGRNHA